MASPSSDSLGQLLRRLSAGRTATDEALSCEAFLAEHHVEPRRVRIGRYLIRKALGRGGFGAVLLAEDPQLRRCVALKVALGVIEGRDERERFAAEAQRLAKFSDPHVVQVFDHGDSPYGPWIAMQYIEGETLHAWCSVPRPWPAVLDAYVQAARGLAAAHAVGLVHRDIKPQNLLRRTDGHVFVSDLGLARVDSTVCASLDTRVNEGSTTADGGGTPGYQAPEVLNLGIADARSDQYALCISLFDALGGHREGGLARSMPNVPRWLQRVITRGLAPEPDARHPDMGALVRALTQPRRRMGQSSLVVIPVAVLVAGANMRDAPACNDLGELSSIWSAGHRESLSSVFERTPQRRHTMARLDSFVEHWTAQRRALCETEYRQDTDAFVAAHACLARRRENLESVLASLRDPTTHVLGDAVLARLDALPSCMIHGETATTSSERDISASMVAFEAIDEAAVALAGGHYRAALEGADLGLRLAIDIDDMDAIAEARLVRGRVLDELGRDEDAKSELTAAAHLAEGARNGGVAVRAWHALTRIAAHDLLDPALAHDSAEYGRVAIARTGPNPMLEAENIAAFADVATLDGDIAEAERLLRAALETRARSSQPDAPEIEILLANALGSQGKIEEAETHYQRVRSLLTATYGDDHPELGRIEFNLGVDARERGSFEEAREHLTRALAIQESAFGVESVRVAPTLVLLAELSLRAGALDEASELATRADAIERTTLSRYHPDRGNALALLAGIQLERGDHHAALETSLRRMDELPTGASEEAEVANMIGWLLCELDRCAEAGPYYSRVRARAEDPVTDAFGEAGLAAVAFALDPASGLQQLEAAHARALAVGEMSLIAEVEERLAGALWRLQREPMRVVELRRAAHSRRQTMAAKGTTLLDAGDATQLARQQGDGGRGDAR